MDMALIGQIFQTLVASGSYDQKVISKHPDVTILKCLFGEKRTSQKRGKFEEYDGLMIWPKSYPEVVFFAPDECRANPPASVEFMVLKKTGERLEYCGHKNITELIDHMFPAQAAQ